MLRLCTLIFQYDIHKNALKSQYYYSDLIEFQNATLTYALCVYPQFNPLYQPNPFLGMWLFLATFDYVKIQIENVKE